MCIIKFSTQQRNGINDMTNNLKIIISVRGETYFFWRVYMTIYVKYLCIQNEICIVQ